MCAIHAHTGVWSHALEHATLLKPDSHFPSRHQLSIASQPGVELHEPFPPSSTPGFYAGAGEFRLCMLV